MNFIVSAFLAKSAAVSSGGVPVGLIVTLVIIAALVIAIAVAVYKIKNGIRQISRNMFGTDSFVQGINNQKREMSETPRSLQAMTGLCLPRIQRDFPEFDYDDYKQKSETVLRSYMNSIEEKNPKLLYGECSTALKDSVKSIITDLSNRGYKQNYDDIVIHRTEISRYTKDLCLYHRRRRQCGLRQQGYENSKCLRNRACVHTEC